MKAMPASETISVLDLVELTTPEGEIPAGASGGVLELCENDTAMVEITSMPALDAVERIVFPRLSKLHRIGAARPGGDGIAA